MNEENQEVLSIYDSLPEDIQEILAVGNKIADPLTQGEKYDEASAKTGSKSTKFNIAQIFFRKLPATIWEGISKAENTLGAIFIELGFVDTDNPFITFLENFNFNDAKLTNEDFIVLNNLYANSVIDYNDIAGTNYEGQDSIFYNPHFYTQLRSLDDKMFIGTTYMWLGDEYNINKMNFTAVMRDERVPQNIKSNLLPLLEKGDSSKDITQYKVKPNFNVLDFRIAILCSDNKSQGTLNDRKVVERVLTDASQNFMKERNKGNAEDIVKEINKLNKDKQELLIKHITDPDSMSDSENSAMWKLYNNDKAVSDIVNSIKKLSLIDRDNLKGML